jgi:hypothetical protein
VWQAVWEGESTRWCAEGSEEKKSKGDVKSSQILEMRGISAPYEDGECGTQNAGKHAKEPEIVLVSASASASDPDGKECLGGCR